LKGSIRPRRRCLERLEQSARRIIMSKMNSVVHFEMPYDDRERMAKFYQNVFGWQTQMFGEEMGNYVLATTTETDESGPKKPGAINGGFFPKKPDWPAQYPSLVIAVDDIQAAMRQVTDAGGNVLGEPLEIPGVGQYVSSSTRRATSRTSGPASSRPASHSTAPAPSSSLTASAS
jgi:hypothetical protein